MSEKPWYEQQTVKDKLVVFGRALQGTAPFDVVIDPDGAQGHCGYCSFEHKKIVVNPTLFAGSTAEQYLYTKALLVHEAGHRRYTTPSVIPDLVTRTIANLLEDERIERRMCEEFMGVRWLINKLSTRLHQEAIPIDQITNSPQEILVYLLHLRWAMRVAQPVKGCLSSHNQRLWSKIEPLVLCAWQAVDSEAVDLFAAKIAEILGFDSNLPG